MIDLSLYSEFQYLNYTDLNIIENRIIDLNELGGNLVEYTPTEWKLNDFPYIENIDNIENGIYELITTYANYDNYNFIPKREWKIDNEYKPTSFGYIDINKWINNLNLLKDILEGSE